MSTFILQTGGGRWLSLDPATSVSADGSPKPTVNDAGSLASDTSCYKYWRTTGLSSVPSWWSGIFSSVPDDIVPDPFALFLPAAGVYIKFSASPKGGLATQSTMQPSTTTDPTEAALFIFPEQWLTLVTHMSDHFDLFNQSLSKMDSKTPIMLQELSGDNGISVMPFVFATGITMVTNITQDDDGQTTVSEAIFDFIPVGQMGFGCVNETDPSACNCADKSSDGMYRPPPWYKSCAGGLVFGGWGQPLFDTSKDPQELTGYGAPSIATVENTFALVSAPQINCTLPPAAAIDGGAGNLKAVDKVFEGYKHIVLYISISVVALLILYGLYVHFWHVRKHLNAMEAHAIVLQTSVLQPNVAA